MSCVTMNVARRAASLSQENCGDGVEVEDVVYRWGQHDVDENDDVVDG